MTDRDLIDRVLIHLPNSTLVDIITNLTDENGWSPTPQAADFVGACQKVLSRRGPQRQGKEGSRDRN